MTIYEIIDGLIDEGDSLLDESARVPMDERNDNFYKEARKHIHEHLPTKEAIELVCYHETGHYFAAVEAATQLRLDSSQFKIVGPSIRYNPKVFECYNPTSMGLFAPGLENRTIQTEVELILLARVSMAGGESVRHFYGSKAKRGDKNDISKFTRFCKTVPHCVLTQEPKIYMAQARRHFRSKLRDTEFKVRFILKAENVKQELFGPVFDCQTQETPQNP
jgi:hypothetical protein